MAVRRLILVSLIMEILKDAIPEVGGRVFHQSHLPADSDKVPCILITRQDEQVEPLDEAPPTATRLLDVEISPVVKGTSGDSEREVEMLVMKIERVMRELQFVATATYGSDCLIDSIRERHVSGVKGTNIAELEYSGVTITYQAEYVTDEGSTGKDEPGTPVHNVLNKFEKAVATWRHMCGENALEATDEVHFEEE